MPGGSAKIYPLLLLKICGNDHTNIKIKGEIRMSEIIKVNFENETISARDLYDIVNEGKERFSKWFSRQLQFGFTEGEDYSNPFQKVRVQKEGVREVEREVEDYELSIDMAKQICMVQKNENAKRIRKYLIELEKAWNTPDQVMARALKMADKTIKSLQLKIDEQKPLVEFANQVSDSTNLIDMGKMAKLMKDQHINIGRNRLFQWLRDCEILMYNNVPYQRYVDSGYFVVKESVYSTPSGENRTQQTTYITGKGQIYIIKKYKKYQETD